MQALKDDHVWLEPDKKNEFSVAIGAKVISMDSGQIQLQDDDGRYYWLDGGQILPHMHVTSVNGVEDMISLGDLSEAAILRNLFHRYRDNQIYTYTGSILISVNPYKELPIYKHEQIERYKDKKIGELPPHIFAIADNAYSSMKQSQQDQCIIISGESGSGKSECTKLILQYLTSVSGQQSSVAQQILEAYPILEAFGNAKTIQNDNSSRFGKYIDIHFDGKGVIEGAKIEQYLLEKSRIVSQRHGERNYHIFYCMLAGLTNEGKKMFELQDAENFDYLLQGEKIGCESRDDEKDFENICSAMKILMFDGDDIINILKILSSLLHIGNVKFNEFELDNIEASEIEDVTSINITAAFLEVDPQALIDALTTKTIIAKDESVTYTMKKMQAMDVRDAFAKGIYGRLFVWIVNKINAALFNPQQQQNKQSIKVLDIFSFENFEKNSFEQLCINYAIESLQQFFVTHVFKLEQMEYNNENINWKNIEFVDNQGILDLIADKPMNILSLMDEESKFPKGTDESMLNKFHFYHSSNQYYLKPKAAVTQTFGLKHFAGLVIYDSKGFLEKNRDTFSPDLAQLVNTSKSGFMKTLFTLDNTENDARKKTSTLAMQFKKSLEQLMTALNACHPYFIRCIKPNDLKKPHVFNRELCCKQLRYLGMMETIRIRRAGYPIRHRFSEFVGRYRMLVKGLSPAVTGDSKTTASKICSALLTTTDYKFGRTKLFLKVAQDSFLEQQREKILSENMRIIQQVSQTWLCRKQYLKMKQGFTRLQAVYRSRKLSRQFRFICLWVVNLQSLCRGYLLRQKMKKKVTHSNHLEQVLQKNLSLDTTDSRSKTEGNSLENKMVPSKDSSAQNNLDTVRVEKESSDDTFTGFAAKHFQDATYAYSCKPLKKPLLPVEGTVDQMASLALWTVILKYMLAIPESKEAEKKEGWVSIMTRIQTALKAKINSDDFNEILAVYDSTVSSLEEFKESDLFLSSLSNVLTKYASHNCFLADPPTSDLDKVQFVIGLGIIRKILRDEIYCQICKQLTCNDNESSIKRGWILLSSCISCFPPSEKFLPCLLKFISDSSSKYASTCNLLLQQLKKKGERKQPPSLQEYQFLKSGIPISLTILLTDGTEQILPVNTFTTVEELSMKISKNLNLRDNFGFSFFVDTLDMVNRMDEGTFVMDVVSKCEQMLSEARINNQETLSNIYFRKEIFTPWHDPTDDLVATQLIYSQVVKGIATDEYSLEKDDDLAMIAAQRYFIDHGIKLDKELLRTLINTYIPESYLQEDSDFDKWINLVGEKLKDSYFLSSKTEPKKVIQDIVSYSRFKWPLLFSRFYEVNNILGPQLSKNEVQLAINWTGTYAIDDNEEIMLELSFSEILSVTVASSKTSDTTKQSVTLCLINSDKYSFFSNNAENLKTLIMYFMEGLQERSKYAIAIKSFTSSDNSTFKKGDLILLDAPTAKVSGNKPLNLSGVNMNNGKLVKFPADCVYVIPTMTKPPLIILNLLTHWAQSQKDVVAVAAMTSEAKHGREDNVRKPESVPSDKPHTLENFAKYHFRVSKKAKPRNQERWKYNKKPLKHPLLKELVGKEDIKSLVYESYIGIMKYMGDYPTNKTRISSIFFTDQIFTHALINDLIRDEIFCLLMKQLTENKNSISEERGWELLWLAVGLCEPSSDVWRELKSFIITRSHISLAADCLRRLEKRKNKRNRKYPPHLEEVEAVQQKRLKISHEVHFPNGNDELFDIDSSMTAKELCQDIAKSLGLKSTEGFSLYIHIGDKILSLAEDTFFFDFLRPVTEDLNVKVKSKKAVQGPLQYEIFFQKKIWVETLPGADLQADLIFHYNQMFPTYFNGYHKCNKQEAAELGALIYRVMNGEDESNFSLFPELLRELVPLDLMCEQPTQEWTNDIITAFHKFMGKTQDESTVEFLKIMSTWGTFGAEFYEVKQTSLSNIPGKILVGINENGLHLLNTKTKELHLRYPLSKISGCKYDETSCTIYIKGSLEDDELRCLTPMSYRMHDLLTSYMKLISQLQQ